MTKKKVFIGIGIAVLVVGAIIAIFMAGRCRTGMAAYRNAVNQSAVLTDAATGIPLSNVDARQAAELKDGIQEIKTELQPYGYPEITVQKDVPVKWILNADARNLNACNNELTIPGLNITKKLSVGENIIEFTPTESGVLPYSCWMGMQNGTIAVVDDLSNIDSAKIQEQINVLPRSGGCCGI